MAVSLKFQHSYFRPDLEPAQSGSHPYTLYP